MGRIPADYLPPKELWPERRDCAEGCFRHPDVETP